MSLDSEKRTLPWGPEEFVSGSNKADIKGKEIIRSDLLPDPTHGFNFSDDIRIPITTAGPSFSEEKTVSREELAKILTPEPLPVHDDRVRRSSLWDSAVAINPASTALGEDSEARRNEIREETRAGKQVVEIEAAGNESPRPLLPLPVADSDVESHGRSPRESPKEVDVFVHNLEIEKPANRVRSEMKAWVQKSDEKRNSMAERLSELLKARPAFTAVSEAESTPRERKRVSDAFKDKQVAELNRSPLPKKITLAERMPPEWVLLLLGCIVGLSSGLSVVAFNKLVCLLQICTLLVSRLFSTGMDAIKSFCCEPLSRLKLHCFVGLTSFTPIETSMYLPMCFLFK